MNKDGSSAIPSLKKRRGVIRSSITRLANRLSVLRDKPPNRDTLEAAQQTLQRLIDLQAEFEVLHFDLVDLIEDDKTLESEQEVFDTVNEQVDDTKIHIKKIINSCTTSEVSSILCNEETLRRGVARGGQRGHLPPLFSRKTKVYLYLNELLPQIVDLVVLTLRKYHTKAGNKAVLIADSARARR